MSEFDNDYNEASTIELKERQLDDDTEDNTEIIPMIMIIPMTTMFNFKSLTKRWRYDVDKKK